MADQPTQPNQPNQPTPTQSNDPRKIVGANRAGIQAEFAAWLDAALETELKDGQEHWIKFTATLDRGVVSDRQFAQHAEIDRQNAEPNRQVSATPTGAAPGDITTVGHTTTSASVAPGAVQRSKADRDKG